MGKSADHIEGDEPGLDQLNREIRSKNFDALVELHEKNVGDYRSLLLLASGFLKICGESNVTELIVDLDESEVLHEMFQIEVANLEPVEPGVPRVRLRIMPKQNKLIVVAS